MLEDIADSATATSDGSVPAHLAGISVDGSNADQGGDAAAAKPLEFGQVGNQGPRGDFADARHGGQEIVGSPSDR